MQNSLHICAYARFTPLAPFPCRFKKQKTPAGCLLYGDSADAIPSKTLAPWQGDICAAHTGPNTGLTRLELDTKPYLEPTETPIAGCTNWNTPREYAYGISLSLYEEDRRKIPETGSSCPIMGDPVADVFGISVRENACVMALADGVNWGRKSRLAARCATHAVMEHLAANVPRMQSDPSSRTVTQLLREAVTERAQELVLRKHATLTTLSAAVVCETSTPGEWALYVCAVGDSPVYVYCPHSHQLFEATVGCHTTDGIRDMRMAGGVLGPSYGSKPDLSNITYAYMPVYPGDIVFAVSDGVSDNFSTKVMNSSGKTCVSGEKVEGQKPSRKPSLRACCENIPHLAGVLNRHEEHLERNISAQTVAACLINHSVEVTEKKRLLRTQCLEENIDMRREAARNPEFAARLEDAAGKLDHASVVAYQVGRHYPY